MGGAGGGPRAESVHGPSPDAHQLEIELSLARGGPLYGQHRHRSVVRFDFVTAACPFCCVRCVCVFVCVCGGGVSLGYNT